jgi:hypothetical protein
MQDKTPQPSSEDRDFTNSADRPEGTEGASERPAAPQTSPAPHTTPEALSGPHSHQDEAPTPDATLTAVEGAALIGKPEPLGEPLSVPAVEDESLADEARAAAHFASDAKTHTMTVHREDGPFRHVEFTGLAGLSRIILVTWPYNLLVAGSHGSYHFERYGPDTEDMFNWLRGTRVNPDSWASKLVNGRDSVTEYSRQLLVAEVGRRVQEALTDGWAPTGLVEAVAEEILGSHLLDNEGTALQLVDEFEHGEQHRAECSCGTTSRLFDDYHSAARWNATTHLGSGKAHQVRVRQTGGFDFSDIYDWNVRKLNYHYLWTCHGAVWAIGQYDAARAARPAFFEPGRSYTRPHHGETITFVVEAVSTSPDGRTTVAHGWRKTPYTDGGWEPTTADDFTGWTDVTEAVTA